MPLVYVGRHCFYHGRPLWEILLNLKNFGVGRIVARNRPLTLFPEITYFRILSVEPKKLEYPNQMEGTCYVDRIFRGIQDHKPFEIGHVGYKPDYFLIPKHEEEAFINSRPKRVLPDTIHPRYCDYPPLWKEMVKREKALKNEPVTPRDLQYLIKYTDHEDPQYKLRIAEEGETPSYKAGQFKPARPELYKEVIWDINEAKVKLGPHPVDHSAPFINASISKPSMSASPQAQNKMPITE